MMVNKPDIVHQEVSIWPQRPAQGARGAA